MKGMIRGLLGVALSLSLFGWTGAALGQDGPPKPTPEHERLKKDVGTWDATIKSWMRGPDSEPTVSQGVEVVKLMTGGLWLQSEFDGKFGEMDFHGAGQSGYDPKKGKYVGTWADSLDTSLMIMEGDYDSASHTMTMHSKGTDPSGKPYESKMVSKHEGDDSRVFTMYIKSDETKGEYVKMMEISYKRRSK
jgi:hypothetical protein